VLNDGLVLQIVTQGLVTVISVAAPPLVMGLAAGLIMAIFQTVTSIQEPTLAFIPKIIAVLGALIMFGPFMLGQLTGFFEYLAQFITDYMA